MGAPMGRFGIKPGRFDKVRQTSARAARCSGSSVYAGASWLPNVNGTDQTSKPYSFELGVNLSILTGVGRRWAMSGKYVGLGVAMGASLGAAFDHPAIGVSIGIVLGVIISASRSASKAAQDSGPKA